MSHLPDFLDHLQDAVDAAEVGFLFDEGGCYGMALALHAALAEEGLRPQFKDYDDLDHAVVWALGKDCDYRGADVDSFGQPRLHPETTTPEAFLAMCVRESNWDEEKIEADRDLALDIIANAREMAAAAPAP